MRSSFNSISFKGISVRKVVMIEIPCFLPDPRVFLEDTQIPGQLPTVDLRSVAVTLPDSRDYRGLAQTYFNIIF